MATRLNPSDGHRRELVKKLEYAARSANEPADREQAGDLLARMTTLWAVSPSTDMERRARRQTCDEAAGFLYGIEV